MKPPTSLSLMLQARRVTQAHLDCIVRQIATRAERRVRSQRPKARQFGRGRSTWSMADERAYQHELLALTFERQAEIDALSRKLGRQDDAIQLTTRRPHHADVHD